MTATRPTLRDEVMYELAHAGFPLDYESLATRIGANQASIRVATRQLQIAGLVRTYNEDPQTGRKSWVPVIDANDASSVRAAGIEPVSAIG
jgi:predicted transcriptional regulator